MNFQLNKNKFHSSKLQIYSKIIKEEEDEENKTRNEYDYIISLLKKPKKDRSKTDKLQIQTYLTTHIDYFKNLSAQIDKDTFLKIISNINYHPFEKNIRVMNFGEEGDKFYIILKGSVTMCKPIPKEKLFTLREYVQYLLDVRDKENNISKFERIQDYNSKISKYKLLSIEYDYTKLPETKKTPFVIEEERETDILYKGEIFGEIALIKNEPRNSSAITAEKCDLISIEKGDYSKIKDIEEQRINNKLVDFRNDFPMFKYWSNSKCFRLISGFITEYYNKGEYIYKQNDKPDCIYFVKEGILEVFTEFSFSWYEQFIEYIHDCSKSLTNYVDNPILWKEDKIQKRIHEAYEGDNSPFVLKKSNMDKIIISHNENNEENNINILKNINKYNKISNKNNIFKNNNNNSLNEEDSNKLKLVTQLEKNEESAKKNLYKANIQKLCAPQIFGYLEALELKKRFCTVKCFSNDAVVLKFPFNEFLQLLPTDKKNQFYLQQRIFEEKKHLIEQLKNNALAKLNFMELNNDKKKVMKIFDAKENMRGTMNQFRCTKYLNNFKNINFGETLYSSVNLAQFGNEKNENDKNLEIINLKQKLENKENKKFYETNGLIMPNFKKTMIRLNKKRFEAIKNLYPQTTKRNNSNTSTNNNLKLSKRTFSNINSNYIKFLEKSSNFINKTPSKLISSLSMTDLTAKNYYNFESNNKFFKKIKQNNNNKESRNIKTILPNIIAKNTNDIPHK